jgi:hypothetical protein
MDAPVQARGELAVMGWLHQFDDRSRGSIRSA